MFGLGHSEGPGLEGAEGAERAGKVSNKGGFDTIAGAADCPTPRKVPVAGRVIQVSLETRSTEHVYSILEYIYMTRGGCLKSGDI